VTNHTGNASAMPSGLERALEAVNRLAMWIAGAAVVLLALHVCVDAIGKYVFGMPIPATLEVVAYYYMPAIAMLPLAHVELKEGHVAVLGLFQKLPGRARAVVAVLGAMLGVSFLSIITYLAGRDAIRKMQIGEYMFGEYPIILWPGRFVFTAGMVLFVIAVVLRAIRVARKAGVAS
jgi:TRAP-type mannitol/chloroaromatic compound transport system permease small subunit